MRVPLRIFSLAMLLILSACMRAGTYAINFPTAFDDDVTVVSDIAYGSEPEEKLDIYMPTNPPGLRLDVIVFYYGGRWTLGSKEDYRFVGHTLANQGFIVVIPDYRKYPEVKFPVFVQDSAKALSWVYDNIDRYHGAHERIHVAGHSAGAHIGALLATDAHYLAEQGKDRSTVIRSFAGLGGPYSFTPDEPDLIDMFGPPENYPLMQVPTFVDGKQPPMLLLHGIEDKDVKVSNLELLQQAIESKGGYVESIVYPKTAHIGIVLGLSWLTSRQAPVLNDMVTFFNKMDNYKGP
jgi:acetyl esterase/lipase